MKRASKIAERKRVGAQKIKRKTCFFENFVPLDLEAIVPVQREESRRTIIKSKVSENL